MKSRLSATHLLRHLALFLFIGVFLLTLIRAAYVLWQFPKAIGSNALLDIFVMGLRYDLALMGILLLPVVVLGSLFGMLGVTRGFAKFLVIFLLMLGMFFILVSELITPYFLAEQGVRPDLSVLTAIKDPVTMFASLWSAYMIPAIIGLVLTVLIIVAYWSRLETNRLLRFPLKALSSIVLLIVGVVLCGLAIYSGVDPSQPPLSPSAGLISSETIINEITINSGYKMLYSFVAPFLG